MAAVPVRRYSWRVTQNRMIHRRMADLRRIIFRLRPARLPLAPDAKYLRLAEYAQLHEDDLRGRLHDLTEAIGRPRICELTPRLPLSQSILTQQRPVLAVCESGQGLLRASGLAPKIRLRSNRLGSEVLTNIGQRTQGLSFGRDRERACLDHYVARAIARH